MKPLLISRITQAQKGQYSKYQGRIGNTPEQERVLNQIGRQQEVRSGLYLLLLQKREENSISLAATADKGKLIAMPLSKGQISPKKSIVFLMAFFMGLLIPLIILSIKQMLRYRIEAHDDVASLTKVPIVADVPMANESAKTKAGIVVQANKNTQMDEVFRSLRTNVPQNAPTLMIFTVSGITTQVRLWHCSKASYSISSTELGMTMSVRLQLPNASSPMTLTELGMTVALHPTTNLLVAVSIIALQPSRESYPGLSSATTILVRLVQPENASLPIPLFTGIIDFGMTTLVRFVHALKADEAIDNTESGKSMLVSPVHS